MVANPPDKIYAFVQNIIPPQHKGQQRSVFGVAVHVRTGQVLGTAILPTKQRVQLALGIGNDQAHSHHKYRQFTKNNYILIWTDEPNEEPDLLAMRDRINATKKAPPGEKPEPEKAPQTDPTEALVKAGADSVADETRKEIEQAKVDTKGFF